MPFARLAYYGGCPLAASPGAGLPLNIFLDPLPRWGAGWRGDAARGARSQSSSGAAAGSSRRACPARRRSCCAALRARVHARAHAPVSTQQQVRGTCMSSLFRSVVLHPSTMHEPRSCWMHPWVHGHTLSNMHGAASLRRCWRQVQAGVRCMHGRLHGQGTQSSVRAHTPAACPWNWPVNARGQPDACRTLLQCLVDRQLLLLGAVAQPITAGYSRAAPQTMLAPLRRRLRPARQMARTLHAGTSAQVGTQETPARVRVRGWPAARAACVQRPKHARPPARATCAS